MKTKNNVQKAVLRFAAIVVSFVLVSYTVSAQDFWKRFLENSSFGHIAMAMVEHNETDAEMSENLEANAEYFYEAETESQLELESWMINESNFAISAINFEQATDEALELESWMLDQNLFQTSVETESALQLEEWMVSADVWNI